MAAAITLGLRAVGRPGCGAGAEALAALLAGEKDVLVVGENDRKADGNWPGMEGARAVAQDLADGWARTVRWAMPPEGVKDLRSWLVQLVDDGLDLEAPEARDDAGLSVLDHLDGTATNATATSGGRRLVVRAFETIEPREVEWLWAGRIPLGMLTLLIGDPGLGKSLATVDIASVVSRGADFCDGTPAPEGDVLMMSAEDSAECVVRPRLQTAGADLARVHDLKMDGAWFSLDEDLDELERAIRRLSAVRLVVIDPISSYLGGIDGHKNAEMRALLGPLSELAERSGVAVVAIHHLNKSGGKSAVHRASGSIALTAVARSALLVAQDPDAPPHGRLLVSAKANLAPAAPGLAFTAKDVGGHARLAWDPTPLDITADDVLSQQQRSGTGTRLDEARVWLESQLANGPVPVATLKNRAGEDGLSWAGAVRKASKELGILKIKQKGALSGAWSWQLPPEGEPEGVRAGGRSTSNGRDTRNNDESPVSGQRAEVEQGETPGGTAQVRPSVDGATSGTGTTLDRYDVDERSAILEFDAGLPRDRAESQAAREVAARRVPGARS